MCIDYHKVIFVELSFYHFRYYVLCLERLFTFSFVCYFDGHMLVGSLLYLCGRETCSAFSFEYSFAYIFLSILSYCLFASKLSLLAFILFRAASS